jgi:prenyltransferase beta subunit
MINGFKKIMAKKSILIVITISILVLTVLNPVFVLGATRRAVLVDFIVGNQDVEGGFYEYREDDSEESLITIDATRSSLAILDRLNQLSQIDKDDQEDAASWLTSGIDSNIQNENNTVDFALALEGLETLDALDLVVGEERNEIITYLDSGKETIDNNTSYRLSEESVSSVSGIFFTLKSYDHLSNSSTNLIDLLVETEKVTNFLELCIGSNGGFKSDLGSESTPSLISTFFALKSLELMNTLNDLDTEQLVEISSYVESFYVDNEDLQEHHGGFSFISGKEIPVSSLLATYCATIALNLLDGSEPSDNTIRWVLKHQNSVDGGFSESVDPSKIKKSSAVSSFYAVQILEIGDPNLSVLTNEFLTYSIDWVLIVGITVAVIAVIVAVIVIYRRRIAL